MGDGGGDEIKQHDTVPGGISLLGTDGKRYVVDEATASYFYEIEGLITKDPETPEEVEERTVLAGNALEEAVGHRRQFWSAMTAHVVSASSMIVVSPLAVSKMIGLRRRLLFSTWEKSLPQMM